MNAKESILVPYKRSQLRDTRNCKDLSDNEHWIWIRETLRRTQTYVWCIFDVISKNNTTCKTQWHGASFDRLTASRRKKDTKLAKSQQYFKQLLTDKTRQRDWNGIEWHLQLRNSILCLHKKIKDVKILLWNLDQIWLVHISVKDFWHIVEWDIYLEEHLSNQSAINLRKRIVMLNWDAKKCVGHWSMNYDYTLIFWLEVTVRRDISLSFYFPSVFLFTKFSCLNLFFFCLSFYVIRPECPF